MQFGDRNACYLTMESSQILKIIGVGIRLVLISVYPCGNSRDNADIAIGIIKELDGF